MAKKRDKDVIRSYELQHRKEVERQGRAIERLFERTTNEIALYASKIKPKETDKPINLKDYPQVEAMIKQSIARLTNDINVVVTNGIETQWTYANQKHDAFLKSILDTSKLTESDLKTYQDRNLDALKTFQSRKVNGMNLSKRVWNYTEQYKKQIELSLDVGIGKGTSAQSLARDLKKNLKDPDRLYRRLRDKHGNLQLSKNAKAFHPGRGIYRSSTKNAQRLARNEINMAYREADQKRWSQLDFVIGYNIQTSAMHNDWLQRVWNKQNPGKVEICDKLAGRYPKWFKFRLWHPNCWCYATPIMTDFYSKEAQTDRINRLRSAMNGTEYKKYVSKDTVTEVPDGFKQWMSENVDKQWKSPPYFVQDNFIGGNIALGLKGE